MVMRFKSLLVGLVALSVCSGALAQQTVVGGPGAPPATSGGGSPGGSSGQIQYNNGGSFGGISTFTNSSGVLTNSASATGATLQLTGTETASTSSAMLYVDPASTSSTTFSANGTLIGANAVSGFTGNLIDLQLNGNSEFKITSGGAATFASTVTGLSLSATTTSGSILTKNGNPILEAAPTAALTGTGAGSSPPSPATANSSLGFVFTATSGSAASTFTINFLVGATHGWVCNLSDQTTATTYIRQTGSTTTTATFQAYTVGTTTAIGLASGDVVGAMCSAY